MSTGARDRAEPMEAPDLFGLDYETRVRIAVADTQGQVWGAATCPGSPIARVPDLRYANANYGLPDYLRDPAAWGALMEKESLSVGPVFEWHMGREIGVAGWMADDRHLQSDRDRDYPRVEYHTSIGKAVCLAVLAKHGITVEP